MKKYFNLFAVISITVFQLSCDEDKDNINPDPSNSTLIKTAVFDYGQSGTMTDYFFYDSNNRLIRRISESIDSTVIEYSDKIIIEKSFEFSGVLDHTGTFFLNDQNLIDSFVVLGGELRVKNIYNSDGYLISAKNYNSNNALTALETYTVTNGNITSLVATKINGELIYSDIFSEFDTNGKNSLGYANFGQAYYGKSSVNFPKKRVYQDDFELMEYEHKITYDNLGRIIKVEFILQGVKDYDVIITYY